MPSPRACEMSGYTVSRQGDFASASVAQRIADCAECGGTGLLRGTVSGNGRSYDVVQPCPRSQMVARARAFDEAHLPAVHANAGFDTYRPSNAEQARAHQVARDFALRFPQVRGFIVSGPVGTGKTHLLCASLKHLALEVGARVAYVEISLLYAQIRRGFQDGRSGGEIIQPLSQVDVLAIDELGKGRGSAFELDTLDELIARRYNSGRLTLFATNYSLKSPEDRAQRGYLSTETLVDATRESKLLCDRVGDRIYSRLCEMCEFVELPANTADQRRTRGLAERPPSGPSRR
ncbi:MAG: ATP-binding protein [Myxococcaceae bacterium]|jgi:DNA replication protein DnaC|nr:ATP-binding protein [Myxococcaceae bacterium]